MNRPKARKNRLAHEASPYLLQHADNPVDWYPWGEEALLKAKREQKPIFLSIGYSACHWCHVMAHESFEDEATAEILNRDFINIKVDREERPDLDHIYMSAVQLMTQHGGWPMSVFLTPELEPFYGGTYFPPEDRMGMPSFKKILAGVANAWKTKRAEVVQSASQLAGALKSMNVVEIEKNPAAVSLALVDQAADKIAQNFDDEHGGFGAAPKFFHTMDLRVALRHAARTGNKVSRKLVELTLDKMANGGIYDQLAGGFHRYSTDARWLVPHFEKMLYDNALLAVVYLEAFQFTHHSEYARVASETLNYVLREMTSPEGGFYSTQDADSEGHEGKFYVWSKDEVQSLLDKETAELFSKIYDVTPSGNWEGKTILNRKNSLESWSEKLGVEKGWIEDSLARGRRKLLTQRETRVAPHRDEKVLASWNGMMIEAMALGAQVLQDERYLAAAENAANFIWQKMKGDGAKLYHVYKDENAKLNAYLDDYSAYLNGLLTLYETTFKDEYLTRAEIIAQEMINQFWDGSAKAFYFTAKAHEKLITRPQEMHDGATPSATGMAILGLARLGELFGNQEYLKIVETVLQQLQKQMSVIPTAFGQSLLTVEFLFGGSKQFVLVRGKDNDEWDNVLGALRARFLPNKVVAAKSDIALPLFVGRDAVDGKTTLYVCENQTCRIPFVGESAILENLKTL